MIPGPPQTGPIMLLGFEPWSPGVNRLPRDSEAPKKSRSSRLSFLHFASSYQAPTRSLLAFCFSCLANIWGKLEWATETEVSSCLQETTVWTDQIKTIIAPHDTFI